MKSIFDENRQNWRLDFSDQLLSPQQVYQQVAQAIANDTNGKVRQALIKLGWTPPPSSIGNPDDS